MRGRMTIRDVARGTGVAESRVRKVRRGGGVLGDAKSLALAVGVTPATVRRWKRSGVPLARLEAVVEVLADREAVERGVKKERKRVRALVSKARKAGFIPRAKPKGTTRFGGARAVGQKTIYHLNRYLDPDTLDLIEELTIQAPKGPSYIVTLKAIEAGVTGKVRGYGGVITRRFGKKSENIRFATAITSGAWSSKRKALDKLFSKIQDAIADADSLIYILDLVVFSYRYR